ncbi:MAG TPA: hypothetical protein VMS64_17355 [Candidatus Methylomirabilis sp.]|nr:hypothetical protein [Candidatus Methylomirabilis sp.]
MYFPTSDDWEAWPAGDLGFDPSGLAEAIVFHRAHETPWRPGFITASGRYIGVADEPESSGVLGPVRPRGGPNGLVVRGGRIAAKWASLVAEHGRRAVGVGAPVELLGARGGQ